MTCATIDPRTLTTAELAAMTREIEYLDPHTTDDATWRAAALAGECYCAGRFVCTRHAIGGAQ